MKHKSYFQEVSEEWSRELEKAGGKIKMSNKRSYKEISDRHAIKIKVEEAKERFE